MKFYQKKILLGLLLVLITSTTINILHAQNMILISKQPKGLKVGDSVNDFTAKDQNDSIFKLSDALKKGLVVIIFYRGQWCPVCNKHLSHLQDSLKYIYEKGAQVVAISPEKSEFLRRTAEKTDASFSLLYDEGYKIMYLFDVAFRPDSLTRFTYNTLLNANLKTAHSDDSERLPIPATFIIGQDGKIVWRQFDPNYKNRSTVKEILRNIPN